MYDLKRIVVSAATVAAFVVGAVRVSADHERAYQLIEQGNVKALKAETAKDAAVVNSRNYNGMPLLHRAAMTDCVECVRVLLAAGADFTAIDPNLTRSALQCAAGWSTVEIVQVLVSKGAAINSTTKRGDTPLAFARENFYKDEYDQRAKITTFLIENGAK